jgi:peptidoglycan hydrolase CwlO-like protein
MSENNDAILQAIQAGFANAERQFTDLVASHSRLENKVDNLDNKVDNIVSRLANLESEVAEIKTKLSKVENRMHTVDLRLNGVDLRLIDFSDDIRGLQAQQNRVSEYLFNRPQ